MIKATKDEKSVRKEEIEGKLKNWRNKRWNFYGRGCACAGEEGGSEECSQYPLAFIGSRMSKKSDVCKSFTKVLEILSPKFALNFQRIYT